MIDSSNAIEVVNVKKSFRMYYDKGKTLKEKALFSNCNKYEERTVLNGISFQIKKGEAVGLIGNNGCGKSTTLKLLTRIMYPDAGTVELNGRVSSLLELGAGFHPDMSGRENIYINASIFGLGRREIDQRMDDIIEFSELAEFIDNPVRTFSSGMYMRLAFSVAIHVNADILLIDEILAVGDVNFQAKCFNRLMEIREQGTTIVLVSHSMEQVERICGRSIWIHEGVIKADGEPIHVHREYLDYMSGERRKMSEQKILEQKDGNKILQSPGKNDRNDISNSSKALQERRGTGEARITKVSLFHGNTESRYFITGETLRFVMEYEAYAKLEKAVFGICFHRNDSVRCYGTNTRSEGLPYVVIERQGKVSVEFKNCMLLAGTYSVDVTIEKETGDTVDYCSSVVSFEMNNGHRKCSGVSWLEHKWEY